MVHKGRRFDSYMFGLKSLRLNRIRIVLAVLILSFLLSGCTDREFVITTGFESNELMRINDKSCYLPEMMLYLTTVQNKYEAVYGPGIWEQSEDGESLETMVKDMVLAKVAQVKVMNLMADSYNLSLTDEEKLVVSRTAMEFYASMNETERTLIGVSEDDVYDIYCEYALADKVYEYVISDINPEISDDEARKVTVQQILIKTYALDSKGQRVEYSDRAKAEALEKAELVRSLCVEEGASFESLAAKYNEGDEITYSFGRGEMPKAFEDCAFSLDSQAVSEVVETEFGYHIIKSVSKFNLEETQQNKEMILKQRKESVFDETYDEFLITLTKLLNEKLYASIEMIHDDRVKTTSFFDVDF